MVFSPQEGKVLCWVYESGSSPSSQSLCPQALGELHIPIKKWPTSFWLVECWQHGTCWLKSRPPGKPHQYMRESPQLVQTLLFPEIKLASKCLQAECSHDATLESMPNKCFPQCSRHREPIAIIVSSSQYREPMWGLRALLTSNQLDGH